MLINYYGMRFDSQEFEDLIPKINVSGYKVHSGLISIGLHVGPPSLDRLEGGIVYGQGISISNTKVRTICEIALNVVKSQINMSFPVPTPIPIGPKILNYNEGQYFNNWIASQAETPLMKNFLKRIRSQMKEIKKKSVDEKLYSKREAVREELKTLLSKAQNKYHLSKDDIITQFEEAIKEVYVEDVVRS